MWTYQQTTFVSNSCNADLVPDPLTTFLLDYDSGDSFQVEPGDEDVACEIDGVHFTCSEYTWSTSLLGTDVVLTWARTWEGAFLSETEGDRVKTPATRSDSGAERPPARRLDRLLPRTGSAHRANPGATITAN